MPTETLLAGDATEKATDKTAEIKSDVKSESVAAAGDVKAVDKTEVKVEEKKIEEITYDLKAPEGVDFSDVLAFAKEHKLTNDAAQKILDRDSARDEAKLTAHRANVVKWMDDFKADKEFGGDKFAASAESAKRIVDKFGDDELKNALFETGYGNFPPLVRMFAKIGKLMNEGQILSGGPVGDKAKPKSFADALYPDKPK